MPGRTLLKLVVVLVAVVAATAATPRCHLARAPLLTVSAVEPGEGPIAGGTVVTIRGEGFPDRGAEVRFGDAPATAVALVSTREIRATTPPQPNGYAVVTVSAGGRSAILEFLYVPPTLDAIRPGDVTTVAGIGNYVADGRPARTAPVEVTDVAWDSEGNFYIAEAGHDDVRRIGRDGIITRFAGSGLVSPTQRVDELGDGGPAKLALLAYPQGVTVGPTGDLYIADTFHHRIRKVDRLSGVIITVAGSGPLAFDGAFAGDGGPATAARFNQPSQVTFDGRGNMYVLDAVNQRVRKVTPDGIITTVAGTGERGFSGDGGAAIRARIDIGPNGDCGSVKADPDGNLFLADYSNRRIRRIDGVTGTITTVAGGGMRLEDGVPAIEASIRPWGVALDGRGILYFTDFTRIRRVDPRGIVTTVYGGRHSGFSPDGTRSPDGMLTAVQRMTYDCMGDRLVFFEYSSSRLRAIDLLTGTLATLAGIGPATLGENGRAIAAYFSSAHVQPSIDSMGNLIFGTVDGRLRRIEGDGTLRTIAGGGIDSEGPPPTERPALGIPVGVTGTAVAPNGDVYFTEPYGVARVTAGGTYQRVAGVDYGYAGDGGPASLAKLDNPDGISIDPDGNLFVADSWNHCIRRIDARTGIITRFAGKPLPHPPNVLVFNRSGGDGGPALDADFYWPRFVAFDQAGNVYVSDFERVRMIDRQGMINTVVDPQLVSCTAGPLATDPSRRVYVRCLDGQVLRIDGTNLVTRLGTPLHGWGFSGDGGPAGLAEMAGVHGMAIDARGNVYFNDWGNRRIRVIKEIAK